MRVLTKIIEKKNKKQCWTETKMKTQEEYAMYKTLMIGWEKEMKRAQQKNGQQ